MDDIKQEIPEESPILKLNQKDLNKSHLKRNLAYT